MKQTLYNFSVLLTGFNSLNRELIDEYFNQLDTAFPVDFQAALKTYVKFKEDTSQDIELLIKNELHQNPTFKKMVTSIITIWYLGKLDKVTKLTFNPICYFDALAWKASQAHPPGLTGGYFGYWHYPPEN